MLRSLLATCLFFCFSSEASIYNYIYINQYPNFSNYGGLGYIQNPSARFYKEGTLAFSWSHNDPYLRGSIVAYPFEWLEASYQYTDVNNLLYSEVPDFSGSQSYKDKSFDIKIGLLKERNYFPAISLGIRDLGGTALFASEYIVANKLIHRNIDLSLGIGWGNLNSNSISNPLTLISDRFENRVYDKGKGGKISLDSFFSGDAGYFWGIDYYYPRISGLKLILEYDGTNYNTEGAIPLTQDSKYNFGFVKNYSNNLSFKFFYTRGNTFNFGFSYKLELGKKNPNSIKKIPQEPVSNASAIRNVTSRSDDMLYRASLKYLRDNKINLQKASIDDGTLAVIYSQSQFSSPALSAGRVISILDQISPDSINEFKAAEINGGLGLYSVSIDRNEYQRYKSIKSISPLKKHLQILPYNLKEDSHKFNPNVTYPAIFNSLSPDLRSQIGGPDGFFFGDLKLTLNSEVLFSRNLSLLSVISYGVYDNMDPLKLESDSILPHVRTDIVKYLKESRDFSIRRMQLNYYNQLGNSFFYKITGGILESMFGGVGFEALYKPFNRNYGIGLDVWDVKQRDYDQLFNFRDYSTLTGHLSLYYHEPKTHILFKIKGGKYLAKDSGFTFDFSRIFRSGVRVGAFFSLTDISAEEFGEGSFDKGFYFWIPVHIFSERYFKRTFGWGLRPLTRDGAQSVIHGHPLWGVVDSSSAHLFDRTLDDFYD